MLTREDIEAVADMVDGNVQERLKPLESRLDGVEARFDGMEEKMKWLQSAWGALMFTAAVNTPQETLERMLAFHSKHAADDPVLIGEIRRMLGVKNFMSVVDGDAR